MQEVKSSVAKEKDDFLFLLDLLANENNTGLLHEIVKACGEESSLGIAVTSLIDKLKGARKNVLPELDNLIKLIEDNMPSPSLSSAEEASQKLTEDISNNINFE